MITSHKLRTFICSLCVFLLFEEHTMILIYIQKLNPRVSYVFKHIFTRILKVEIRFTSEINEFIAHSGFKFSYGKQALGNELFFQSQGLLFEQGIESIDINVKPWDDTLCFFQVSTKSALPFDIFAASFYLLSRYEEYLPHVKDARGRFPFTESLGYKHQFLESPVVNQWSYKLKEVLQEFFKEITFTKTTGSLHYIVNAEEPFAFDQKGFFRSSVGFLKDLFKLKFQTIIKRSKVLIGLERDPFDTFKWMVTSIKSRKFNVTVFFQMGEAINFETSINTKRQRFRELIKFVSDYCDVGLVVSKNARFNAEILKAEKNRLEEITNRFLEKTQFSELVVGLPEAYRNLVSFEVASDYSMVYEKTSGFRAGTCTPFLFYDLDYEIKTPLMIMPIAFTSKGFDKISPADTTAKIKELHAKVLKVDGDFMGLFSNKNFNADINNKLWRNIFTDR